MSDRRALTAVRLAAINREKAEATFRKSIREAHAFGCSLREIAAEAGVAHTRVFKIVRGE